jgi:hypothetical protein
MALVLFGLFATSIDQFPAPWTQWRRLTKNAHVLQFNTAPAVRFIRASSRPGEDIAVLAALGHLIALEAHVINVSPYSDPDGIVTYEQLDDVLAELRSAHGDTIFTGPIPPEVSNALMARGFRIVAQDAPSALSEWRNPTVSQSQKT